MTSLPRLAVLSAAAVLAALSSAPPAAATPKLPDASKQYWFGNYRIPQVWELGATGQGITVAVIDSGVQADEPELAGVVLPGTNLAGGDGRTDTDRPRGHGTAMARYIAGQGGGRYDLTGIAPNAKILPIALPATSTAADATQYTRAIPYAVDHGAKVINISLATDGSAVAGHCPADVARAVRYAIDKGAVVVAASGNEGRGANNPEYPAACPGVVVVGAVDGSKHAWPDSQRQSYVDVAAPGVAMLDENLNGAHGESSGTSNSAALVSASAALVWSKYPNLTNRQVVARLLASVTDDVTRPGHDDVTGYGIVRPYFAIVDKIPANAPNPIFDQLGAVPRPSASSSPRSSLSSRPEPPSASTAHAAPAGGSGSRTLWVALGVLVGLLLVLALVFVLVRTRRRPARTGVPPGGAPPQHSGYPGPPPQDWPR